MYMHIQSCTCTYLYMHYICHLALVFVSTACVYTYPANASSIRRVTPHIGVYQTLIKHFNISCVQGKSIYMNQYIWCCCLIAVHCAVTKYSVHCDRSASICTSATTCRAIHSCKKDTLIVQPAPAPLPTPIVGVHDRKQYARHW